MPVILPAMLDWNFMPSSTALGSATVAFAGSAVAEKTVQGQPAVGTVVNAQATLVARAFPARSFTRGSVVPPSSASIT